MVVTNMDMKGEDKIYIPHWLDSMKAVAKPTTTVVSDLHSTLVRFYELFLSQQVHPKVHLHSTLVRFYA